MFLQINLLFLIITIFTGCSHRFEENPNRYWFWDEESFDERMGKKFPNIGARETISIGDMELLEVDFEEIYNWRFDDQRDSLNAFVRGCEKNREINIHEICQEAKSIFSRKASKEDAKEFFETYFSPYLIIDRSNRKTAGLVTGYYVPLLNGSRKKSSKFKYPIYEKPRDFRSPYKTHKEIDENGVDARVICWVDDRVDRFFLHIQGSGMVKLEDGSIIGVGYAEKNGYRYTSIGRYIHKNYNVPLHKLSADYIKNWLKKYPKRADEVLYSNESYIFFREQGEGMAIGAMGTNLVPKSTIAVDTKHIPLGVPIYIKSIENRRDPVLNHLFMAQDRGGAIKGVIRADLFFGFGDKAGRGAGTMKRDGEFYMLVPKGFKF